MIASRLLPTLHPQTLASRLTALAAVVCLALGAMWWFTLDRGAHEMAEARIDEAERNDRLALAHEQQVHLVLRTLDEALLTLSDDRELVERMLAGEAGVPRHLAQRGLRIGLADDRGRRAGDDGQLPTGWTERLRAHHRSGDPWQAYVQVPERDVTGEGWVTTLSRSLLDRQGNFIGVVYARLDPRAFLEFFQKAPLGDSDVIVLLGSDGRSRARRTGSDYSFGDRLGDTQGNAPLRKEVANQAIGHAVADSPVDGVRRFYSWRSIENYGLTAMVGTSFAGVMQSVADRNARYRWTALAVTALLLAGGAALALAIARHDRAQARLRASEQRLAGIIESAMDAIITVDSNQRIVVFNAAAADMFRRDPVDTLGQPVGLLLPRRFRSAHPRHMQQFSHTHATPRSMGRGGHIWALRADGQEFPADASISTIEIDGQPLYSVVLRDITARLAAEAKLRDSEESYRLLFENNLDGLLLGDDVGEVGRVNPAACRLLGLTEAQVLERGLEVLRSEENALDLALEECRFAGQARGQFTVARPDGTTVHLEAAFSAWMDSGGRHRSSVILHDVTERHLAQAAQAALVNQLRQSQKMEALGSIAGGIAHDFNNVIAAILGNARLAQGHLGEAAMTAHYLKEINSAGFRARELVKRIMTFSRKQPAVFVRQPLGPVLREAVDLLRATLPSGVTISLRGEDTHAPVRADATQLHQVVMNLGTNAWQAMGQRTGRIDVAIEREPDAPWVRLVFEDNGNGMDAATQARVFEPFFTTKPDGEGTGLGLSVVQGIVEAHQGRISVTSAPGKGCRFEILLPIAPPADGRFDPESVRLPPSRLAPAPVPLPPETAPAPAPAPAPRPEAAAPEGSGRHVVYVDDYEAMVAMVTAVLEGQGFRVSGFDSSPRALAFIEANADDIDLLITDYNMPEMSGLDLTRAARRLRPGLPVIVASGHLSADLRAGAAEAGVNCLFDKPAGIDELCQRIAELLPSAEAQTDRG
ncbi:PAS domain S-box protein [Ramlibacter sp. MAHUQ-53]|uniref:PAS domain S-box protein n=1 Tax=unclassified Ramlibacter TaxID=2617605 RepID=UPI003630B224